MIKQCTSCKVEKELNDFWKNKNSKDGRVTKCIECSKQIKARYRKTVRYRQWKERDISREEVKKARRDWMKKDRMKNPEKYREKDKEKRERYKKNGKIKEWKLKRLSNPKNNLDHRMGCMLRKALRRKNGSWQSLVGYTKEQLKEHLEKQFTEGMTWEVFVKGYIHIDHIKPKHLFKYQTEKDEEFKECWSLTNLQPLWARENMIKNGKY